MFGQTLVTSGIISMSQLDQALRISRNTRIRLGDVLVSEGMVSYPDLYQHLANYHEIAYVDLLESPPDVKLLDAKHAQEYLRMRAMPYKKEGEHLVIATAEYDEKLHAWASQNMEGPFRFVMTSPLDIHRTVQRVFATTLTHQSVMKLYESAPESSAYYRAANYWRWVILLLLVGVGALALTTHATWPGFVTLFAACQVLYALTLIFKLLIYGAGLKPHHITQQELLPDTSLPTYTILIPMYREMEKLANMLEAVQRLDYPVSKLDIKLVFEGDDHEMLIAAQALKPRYHFEIIRVPPSNPRTKPKACNYALAFAKGEYVTVYDADDIPEPSQLKKVVSAFATLPSDVICLQARLNYYNTHDNWLTRLFSLEYAMLFHVLLHGMSRLKMPIMLGGTSNHIALARLRELGEWDPFNVTEDADLGTRLAAQGYRTMMIDSDTMEEAPNSMGAWLHQRTRWIKGYMQTWLVHMRNPVRLLRTLGLGGFLGFQFFVALSSFSYIAAPISWLLAVWWFLEENILFPEWVIILAAANLGFNIVVHVATALHMSTYYPHKRIKMAMSALFYPFYLVLHSIASYLALWQLIVKPYVWNKTTHGKAKTFADFQLTKTRAAG